MFIVYECAFNRVMGWLDNSREANCDGQGP